MVKRVPLDRKALRKAMLPWSHWLAGLLYAVFAPSHFEQPLRLLHAAEVTS